MAEGHDKKRRIFVMNDRRLSVVVFSLFSSWLLSVSFEGRILLALLNFRMVPAQPFVVGAMTAHCAGLILCGFFVRNIRAAKRLLLFSIVFCIAASGVLFFPPSFLWEAALFSSSFLSGCCVAAWGFFLKNGTPKNERIKTIADMLVSCYILTILLGKAAGISPQTGLGLSMLLLGVAFFFALRLPPKEQAQRPDSFEQPEAAAGIAKPLAFLCLFIVIIAIDAGLMFHVQYPAFSGLDWLTSWYWAVPYIVTVFISRNLPRKTNRTYVLNVAVAMTGFSFIAFIMLDRSAVSYLIVNTLMQGAFGVFSLFWWSILGEMLSFHKNPARVLGTGLFANVLGILMGELIGSVRAFGSGQTLNPTLLALSVVCVTLVMLPPLHARLAVLLKNHRCLTAFCEMPHQEQTHLIRGFGSGEKLTEREREIASLLIMGKTCSMIAEELFVSENTVKTHTKKIYAKIGVHNRTELMSSLLDINTDPVER